MNWFCFSLHMYSKNTQSMRSNQRRTRIQKEGRGSVSPGNMPRTPTNPRQTQIILVHHPEKEFLGPRMRKIQMAFTVDKDLPIHIKRVVTILVMVCSREISRESISVSRHRQISLLFIYEKIASFGKTRSLIIYRQFVYF